MMISETKQGVFETKQDVLDRLAQDMELKGFSVSTKKEYGQKNRAFQDYFDKPANELGVEEIRRYLLYLSKEKGLKTSTINTYNIVLRFLYSTVLDMPINLTKIPLKKFTREIPEILTRDEVQALIEATDNLRDKCILMVAYSAGLRVSEVAKLRVKDIDSLRMQIFIDNGKRDKDRYALSAESTLATLREFWRKYKPREHLFISRNKRPMSIRSVQEVFKKYAEKVGISKDLSFHSLRHSFATHLLEDGVNIHHIKQLLGHSDISSTYFYLRLQGVGDLDVISPLDRIVGVSAGLFGGGRSNAGRGDISAQAIINAIASAVNASNSVNSASVISGGDAGA